MRQLLALVVSLILAQAASAAADEMRVGSFDLTPAPSAATAVDGLALRGDPEGMTLSFTPRASTALTSRDAAAAPIPLELSFGLDEHWGSIERLDAMGFDLDPEDNDELMVGGALMIDEIRISGGVGRTTVFGDKVDLVAAGVSVGRFETRLLLGETEPLQPVQREIMVLSTDVMTRPWLSFQGDVAITGGDEEDAEAVGRVGLRLRF